MAGCDVDFIRRGCTAIPGDTHDTFAHRYRRSRCANVDAKHGVYIGGSVGCDLGHPCSAKTLRLVRNTKGIPFVFVSSRYFFSRDYSARSSRPGRIAFVAFRFKTWWRREPGLRARSPRPANGPLEDDSAAFRGDEFPLVRCGHRRRRSHRRARRRSRAVLRRVSRR